jgi:hypothetical protein
VFAAAGVTHANVDDEETIDCMFAQADEQGNYFTLSGGDRGWLSPSLSMYEDAGGSKKLVPAETSAHTTAEVAAPYSAIHQHAYQWVAYTITPTQKIPTTGCVKFTLAAGTTSPIKYCYLLNTDGNISPSYDYDAGPIFSCLINGTTVTIKNFGAE